MQLRAQGVGQPGRRRLLDDLLVAPLHGAVALAQRDDLRRGRRRTSAPRCGAHCATYFSRNTPPSLKLLRGQPLAPLSKARASSSALGAQLHADAAAAGRALQHHRIADALRPRSAAARSGSRPLPGSSGSCLASRQRARGVLEAEALHLRGRRADEGDAGRFAGLRRSPRSRTGSRSRDGWRRRRLRCAASRMASLRAGSSRRRAPGRGRRPRRPCRTCSACASASEYTATEAMPRRFERADDAAGDGAAIGDQDFVEHCAAPGVLRQVVPALKVARDGSSRRPGVRYQALFQISTRTGVGL